MSALQSTFRRLHQLQLFCRTDADADTQQTNGHDLAQGLNVLLAFTDLFAFLLPLLALRYSTLHC